MNPSPPTPLPDTDLPRFAERVEEHRIGPIRLLLLKTPVRDVVSWRGSLATYPGFAAGEEMLQSLAVALLDKGTLRRDRFALAEVLENRGAQLHFSGDALRVAVSGRALTADVPDVLHTMAEQLREPLFDPDEFEKARTQRIATMRRALDSTASQAAGTLARQLYGPAHPNYYHAPASQLAQIPTLTVDDVRAYHTAHFGPREMVLAFVGDVDADAIIDAVRSGLGDWALPEARGDFAEAGLPPVPGRTEVAMPDKQNVDVRMGHALSLRRDDADYLPLFLANFVLGGNFSARLMSVIRDEMGLTYGIRSTLRGVDTLHEGHWQVSVTLSHENVERGIDATQSEVRRFVEGGLTADELDEKQTTVTGTYEVNLATTGGLAASLLRNAERGFAIDYLDRFPEEVRAVTLDQAHAAIAAHLRPEAMHVALAGTRDVDDAPTAPAPQTPG